jgi:hypothetical protein
MTPPDAGLAPDDEADAEFILTTIRNIIEDWVETNTNSPVVLRVGDGGVCRLYLDNESVLHETSTASDMLHFVLAVSRKTSARINGACTTNSPARSRGRPLDPEVAERREWVAETTERLQPASVRQIAYQAEVAGLIPKTENGFRRIQHDLLILRQQDVIDYDWISDNTRWMRKSRSYKGIDHFIRLSISTYRRDLWHDADVYVEIWIEKDALAGTVLEVTDPYDVPLMVARGFSSETYLYEAAQAILREDKPTYIYAFFDRDPSGAHSSKHIERKLREFAPDAEIHFELVAVTEQQIVGWKLPTRETKRGNNAHAKNFVGDSCELDAIPPDRLRDLVRERIERHVDQHSLATLRAAEESEREALKMFAQSWDARP